MDGYFCASQESQGGATTGKSWLSPGTDTKPQSERLSEDAHIWIFFTFPETKAMVQ